MMTIARPTERQPATDLGPPIYYWAALSLLLACMIFGGGARDDILSLLFLRPLTVVMCAVAVVVVLPTLWATYRPLLMVAAATVALVVVHLMPLPPMLWTLLPGREPIIAYYAAAGMAPPWHALSVAPATTWNALFALAAPIAMLILVLALAQRDLTRLLRVVIIVGMVSGLLGLLQSIGPREGPLYFYRITNFGNAVGLFSNRNHQAILLACLLPMLSAHLSLVEARQEGLALQRRLVVTAVVLLVPLLLVTGSRTGLLVGAVGLVAAIWIYRVPAAKGRKVLGLSSHPVQLVFGALLLFGVGLVTFATSRATSLNRLLEVDVNSDLRFEALPAILGAARAYLPFGSGIGSFVDTYRQVEPHHLLSPNYLNHAHNDYAELLLTGGIPAMLLLLWGIAVILSMARGLVMRSAATAPTQARARIIGRLGVALIGLLMLGSAGDYPLRTPSLAVLAAFALACVAHGWRATSGSPAGTGVAMWPEAPPGSRAVSALQ